MLSTSPAADQPSPLGSAAVQMAESAGQTPGTASAGMDVAAHGWFTELSSMWPGQGLSLHVKETLFQDRSKFQDVCVFDTEAFGHVLVLDGVIQCTEQDEFAYQEMITHVPLCGLQEPPCRVLVVGGGDGGVLREVARHRSCQEIHIAEIDGMVPEIAKRFFPQMALGFNDPRVQVHITDGIKFVEAAPADHFDAIIVDSSDPVGPAEVLFQKPFFEQMHRALRPGGVVCTQAESLWLHMPIIQELARMCQGVFQGGTVHYAYTTIPTYPSGQIGFMLCSKAGPVPIDVTAPKRSPPSEGPSPQYPPLRYYTPQLHPAAFVLPAFAQRSLQPFLTPPVNV